MRLPDATRVPTPKVRGQAGSVTPRDLGRAATEDISGAMNAIPADAVALYLKTKSFHWHPRGSHFCDYHAMLDEQADPLDALTDPIAGRMRQLGGSTLRSIGHVATTQRILYIDATYVPPPDMLAERYKWFLFETGRREVDSAHRPLADHHQLAVNRSMRAVSCDRLR